jgi:predicted RNA binding protein YcfA (HicA-like mRNA interferase family)
VTAPGELPRRKLIDLMRRCGYVGPMAGGNHQFMRRGTRTVPIPNPHRGGIPWRLVCEILKQADISERDALRMLGCS